MDKIYNFKNPPPQSGGSTPNKITSNNTENSENTTVHYCYSPDDFSKSPSEHNSDIDSVGGKTPKSKQLSSPYTMSNVSDGSNLGLTNTISTNSQKSNSSASSSIKSVSTPSTSSHLDVSKYLQDFKDIAAPIIKNFKKQLKGLIKLLKDYPIVRPSNLLSHKMFIIPYNPQKQDGLEKHRLAIHLFLQIEIFYSLAIFFNKINNLRDKEYNSHFGYDSPSGIKLTLKLDKKTPLTISAFGAEAEVELYKVENGVAKLAEYFLSRSIYIKEMLNASVARYFAFDVAESKHEFYPKTLEDIDELSVELKRLYQDYSKKGTSSAAYQLIIYNNFGQMQQTNCKVTLGDEELSIPEAQLALKGKERELLNRLTEKLSLLSSCFRGQIIHSENFLVICFPTYNGKARTSWVITSKAYHTNANLYIEELKNAPTNIILSTKVFAEKEFLAYFISLLLMYEDVSGSNASIGLSIGSAIRNNLFEPFSLFLLAQNNELKYKVMRDIFWGITESYPANDRNNFSAKYILTAELEDSIIPLEIIERCIRAHISSATIIETRELILPFLKYILINKRDYKLAKLILAIVFKHSPLVLNEWVEIVKLEIRKEKEKLNALKLESPDLKIPEDPDIKDKEDMLEVVEEMQIDYSLEEANLKIESILLDPNFKILLDKFLIEVSSLEKPLTEKEITPKCYDITLKHIKLFKKIVVNFDELDSTVKEEIKSLCNKILESGVLNSEVITKNSVLYNLLACLTCFSLRITKDDIIQREKIKNPIPHYLTILAEFTTQLIIIVQKAWVSWKDKGNINNKIILGKQIDENLNNISLLLNKNLEFAPLDITKQDRLEINNKKRETLGKIVAYLDLIYKTLNEEVFSKLDPKLESKGLWQTLERVIDNLKATNALIYNNSQLQSYINKILLGKTKLSLKELTNSTNLIGALPFEKLDKNSETLKTNLETKSQELKGAVNKYVELQDRAKDFVGFKELEEAHSKLKEEYLKKMEQTVKKYEAETMTQIVNECKDLEKKIVCLKEELIKLISNANYLESEEQGLEDCRNRSACLWLDMAQVIKNMLQENLEVLIKEKVATKNLKDMFYKLSINLRAFNMNKLDILKDEDFKLCIAEMNNTQTNTLKFMSEINKIKKEQPPIPLSKYVEGGVMKQNNSLTSANQSVKVLLNILQRFIILVIIDEANELSYQQNKTKNYYEKLRVFVSENNFINPKILKEVLITSTQEYETINEKIKTIVNELRELLPYDNSSFNNGLELLESHNFFELALIILEYSNTKTPDKTPSWKEIRLGLDKYMADENKKKKLFSSMLTALNN